MRDGSSLPFICAANRYSFTEWFACLNDLINHPHLNEEEKYVWLWLATQSTNNESLSCSFNYEQISQALDKTPSKIHRILTRLRIMGFLIADLPIYYGEPTPDMVQAIRTIRLMSTPAPLNNQERTNEVVIPFHENRQGIAINLMKRSKGVSLANITSAQRINYENRIKKELPCEN